MLELTFLVLLNRLMDWGLAPLIATRTVAADVAALHRLLSDPATQTRIIGGRSHDIGARVRPSASARVISAEILRGRRTVLWATWILIPGRGTTDVDLTVQFETRGVATRLALALGGRRWLARRVDAALARLAQICADAAEAVVAAPAPAPTSAECAGRARQSRSARDASRAGSRRRTGSDIA